MTITFKSNSDISGMRYSFVGEVQINRQRNIFTSFNSNSRLSFIKGFFCQFIFSKLTWQ